MVGAHEVYKIGTKEKKRIDWLRKEMQTFCANGEKDISNLTDFSLKLYERSYTGLDLMSYIEKYTKMDEEKKYRLLICLQKVKREMRNEKLLILFILKKKKLK